jgi:hypothetical protein
MDIPAAASSIVFTMLRVVGSTVVGKHSAVLVGGEGGVGGEAVTDAEAFGAPGVVFRPRPPSKVDGREIGAEAMAARGPRGMVPVAWRDLRLNRRFPSPKPGSVALVGYGGGFLSFDDANEDTSVGTLYVPYKRNADGTVKEAHMVQLGVDGSGKPFIGLINGTGLRVTLLDDEVVVASKDGSKRLEVNDDGVNAVGPFKAASGADLGGPTSRALALHAELNNLLLPLSNLLTQITTQLSVVGPVAGTPGAYVTPLAAFATAMSAISSTGATLFTKGA